MKIDLILKIKFTMNLCYCAYKFIIVNKSFLNRLAFVIVNSDKQNKYVQLFANIIITL
jgi:hypothetical protein